MTDSRSWQVVLSTLSATAVTFGAMVTQDAQAEGINVGVKPLNESDIDFCLDASSVTSTGDGWTYFQRRACLDRHAHPAEEYRVRCAQSQDGPFEYEMRQSGAWLAFTAQRGDEIGHTIARVCKFERRQKRMPPEPQLQ